MFTTRFLCAATAAMAAALAVPAAAAYPEKDITYIIPFSPGGGFDVYTRLVAPYVEKYLPSKVNIIIKNVPGAGGSKGLGTIYRAKPDGYTIGIANVPGAMIPPILGKKVPYDLEKITWIARLSLDSYVLGVGQKSSIKTFDDFKKWSANNKVKFPSTGPGSTAHAIATVFIGVLNLKGAEIVSGYEGTKEYTIGLIRGDTESAVLPSESTRKYIESGDVRGLVVTEHPSPYKGVPSAKDLGLNDLDGMAIHRLVAAPPKLPADIRAALETAFMKALADPQMKAQADKAQKPLHPLNGKEAEAAVKKELDTYLRFKDMLGGTK